VHLELATEKVTMKALLLRDYKDFVYQDLPEPKVSEDEVLIAVRACGICGSDVHGMDGSTGRRRPPIVMGHEASGVIAEVGEKATGWYKGDRVTFDSTIYCGSCWYCQHGAINLCDARRVLGVSCEDYRQDGAFAEYVAVPHRILYRLPDAVSFERAAMVEAVSVAVHAAGRTPISLGDTAVVVGAGMIGLLVVQALRLAGCGKIIAVDLDAERLKLAQKLGADLTLRADECDVPKEVTHCTRGRGADLAVEVVGTSPSLNSALACVRKGGAVTLVGNLKPMVELPLQTVVTRQLTLYGSCASSGEYPACLDLMARGAIDVEALISATPPLADGAMWFKRLYDREPGLMKVVLIP
jgi:L-iditol 2-dehydrogenase